MLRASIWFSLAVVSTAHPARGQTCQFRPFVEVVTGEDIARFGLTRLTDLFAVAHRWYAHTVDGYTWSATPAALSPLTHQRWRVFVDDVPIPLDLLGDNNLNALPLHLQDVECVEMVSRPDAGGYFLSPSGSIRIYSRRPRVAMTLEGSIAAANEINDPGPFLYTPLATENVDRIGPIATADATLRAEQRFARLAGRIDEFHVTDAQVYDRVSHLYESGSKPQIAAESVALLAGIDAPSGRHALFGGASRTEDLSFLNVFGLEFPVLRRVDLVGAAGTFPVGGGEVRYAGSFVSHDLAPGPHTDDVDPDWRRTTASVSVEANRKSSSGISRVGAAIGSVAAVTSQPVSYRRSVTLRMFGGYDWHVSDAWTQRVYVEWAQEEGRPAAAGMFETELRPGPGHVLAAVASYGRRLPEGGDWFIWSGRGLRLQPREGSDMRTLGYDPLPRVVTVDAVWQGRLFPGLVAEVAAYYRASVGEYLPDREITYDPATSGFFTRTEVVGNVRGNVAGGSASLRLNLVPGVDQRVTFTSERLWKADATLEAAWDGVPRHRLVYSAAYTPVDRFSLTARAEYVPPTRWTEYRNASEASRGFYPWELRDRVSVDLSASKDFWKDHLQVSLALRNVLNEPIRYHPAGAVFNMTFSFAVRASFNSEGPL